MRLYRLSAAIRNVVFPASCACCGCGLEGDEAAYGVCVSCAALLRPETGLRCSRCGRPLVSERNICVECRNAEEPAHDQAYVLFRYGGLARRFLASYKFGPHRIAAPYVARLFAATLAETLAEPLAQNGGYAIVPVPPRPGKMKRCGWDQVSSVADCLERREGLPVSRCLVRLPSRTQKKLDKAERALNMRGVMRCVSPPPSRVVLIDDVLTTGATLNACAGALKDAGSEHVFALALCYD